MSYLSLSMYAKKLQTYNRNYLLSCVSGLFSCRWQRYQQSHFKTTTGEKVWCSVLSFDLFVLSVCLYMWLCAGNDSNTINELVYKGTNKWIDYYTLILAITGLFYTYVSLLFLLSVCLLLVGQQLFIHKIHKAGVVFVGLYLITFVAMTAKFFPDQWHLAYISLQVTGPFLQIGSVIFLTVISWLMSDGWFGRRSLCHVMIAVLFSIILLLIFITPIWIQSPCLKERHESNLFSTPLVFAENGDMQNAPENTKLAFKKALQNNVDGIRTTVQISNDGKPFLYRDHDLSWRTNIKELYPSLTDFNPSLFNWTLLKSLNAGSWFIEMDPFGTAGSMDSSQIQEIQDETICPLEDLLALMTEYNKTIVLNVREPINALRFLNETENGTYYINDTLDIINETLDIINESGIASDLVWWGFETDRGYVEEHYSTMTQVVFGRKFVSDLKDSNIDQFVTHYTALPVEGMRLYSDNEIGIGFYSVNSKWLTTFYQCSDNVTSIFTQMPSKVMTYSSPAWTMTNDFYLITWVTIDVIAIVIITIMFLFQRHRLQHFENHMESFTLSAPSRFSSSSNNDFSDSLIVDDDGELHIKDLIPGANVIHPMRSDDNSLSVSISVSMVSVVQNDLSPIEQALGDDPNDKHISRNMDKAKLVYQIDNI